MRYRFGDHVLDLERRELSRAGDLIAVEPQVFDLLALLIRNRDRVVTKEDMLQAVWGGRIVSESTLFNRLTAARKAIGDDGDRQELIKTLPRKGFRFIGAVEEAATASVLPIEQAEPGAIAPQEHVRESLPSVAVLPFDKLSGDDDYLCDGITGDIITELSRFSELVVISRNSSFSYRSRSVDIRLIGQQLGADYLLEGSLARAGDRVRITAQLIDAETGANRWADRYERHVDDVFALQDEVARTIVATIAVHLGQAEVRRALRRPSATWQAYDFYLQGAHTFASYLSSYRTTDLYRARSRLEQALSLDPGMARAKGLLARTHLTAWINPVDHDHLAPAALDRALRLAEQAVHLDPNLPQARADLGYVLTYARRSDEALSEFDRAFALNPNATDWSYVLALVYAGEPSRAIEHARRQSRLDPFSPAAAHGFAGFAHYMLRQYDAALPLLRDCVRRAPNFRGGHFWLAATHAQLGDLQAARVAVGEVLRIEPGYTINKSGRGVAVFRLASDLEHWIDGLRKAGLP